MGGRGSSGKGRMISAAFNNDDISSEFFTPSSHAAPTAENHGSVDWEPTKMSEYQKLFKDQVSGGQYDSAGDVRFIMRSGIGEVSVNSTELRNLTIDGIKRIIVSDNNGHNLLVTNTRKTPITEKRLHEAVGNSYGSNDVPNKAKKYVKPENYRNKADYQRDLGNAIVGVVNTSLKKNLKKAGIKVEKITDSEVRKIIRELNKRGE